MEKDQIRSLIQKHRASFDDATPDPKLWAGIDERLPRREARSIRIWKWTAAAAVGLLLIAAGVVIGLYNAPGQQNLAMQEYAETEQYYVTQVNEKMAAIQSRHHDPTLEEDLRQLDEIYDELKIELSNSQNPNQKQLIDAMIINYQTKVAILEKVLEKIEDSDIQNTQNDEI